MYHAGCDIGSMTAKAVIIENSAIIAEAVIPAMIKPAESAEAVMDAALKKAGLSIDSLASVTGTGYGSEKIPFADKVVSEISCHAAGAFQVNPEVRMIIDIGGQDAKAIRINQEGVVIRYLYNDKCASGTGRFLEIMAEAMDVPIDEMSSMEKKSREELSISNQCVIFAETEVVSLLNEGKAVPDVIKALHNAMAKRVASLARGVGVESQVVMSGGVAQNDGVFRALGEALKVDLKQLDKVNPQVTGAYGAALLGSR